MLSFETAVSAPAQRKFHPIGRCDGVERVVIGDLSTVLQSRSKLGACDHECGNCRYPTD